MRFIVEEAITKNIVERDLQVLDPQVIRPLSGPATISFTIAYGTTDVKLLAFGHLIHVEEKWGNTTRIIASGIVQPAPDTEIDDAGNMKVTARGFSSYLDGIPWLDNYNPVVVDPFAIVQRIWNHVQSQPNGNIGVTVQPASSGTFMLPGFGFDGETLTIEFFAIFIRATDFNDCMEQMNKLARDIPFDYTEISTWNPERTVVNKVLQLEYPRRGVEQPNISFVLGENVVGATPVAETEIDYISSVIIQSWWPGKTYSATFTNPPVNRFRRVLLEQDTLVNSRERSAALARRKLTRKQIPPHWSQITVEREHPNAPLGTYELGDDILVEGFLPWTGNIREWHRIMGWTVDDVSGTIVLDLKHRDAFNYDPIQFQG